ncbi:SpoVR family protein [Bacillus sp. SL00103]
MPTRFSHWSFGKQFHKMKLHYDLGLSKIYGAGHQFKSLLRLST